MDPLRIAVRVLFAYVVLLVLVRQSGKRAVKHGSPFDFAVSLVLGDMVDDVLWAEVAASEFVVAAGALFAIHTAVDMARFRLGLLR
jgi:uncharacterized membrane protein YcaP (DUF421 family)